jgi:hypothetical protein
VTAAGSVFSPPAEDLAQGLRGLPHLGFRAQMDRFTLCARDSGPRRTAPTETCHNIHTRTCCQKRGLFFLSAAATVRRQTSSDCR